MARRALRSLAFAALGVAISVAVAAVVAIGGGGSNPAIAKPPGTAARDAERIDRAFAALSATCGDILVHWADVAEARGAIARGAWEETALGWTRPVEISIRLRDAVRSAPADWRADGHTLRYVIGAAGAPPRGGFTATKEVEKRFCRRAGAGGERAVYPIADLGWMAE